MKVPISKQLIENLILPCIAITGVGLYDLYLTGQIRFDQNVIFIILFGIPTLLFAWFLLDKRIEFKDNRKVRKANCLIQLPFSSVSSFVLIIIASILLVGGLATMVGENDMSGGLPFLLTGISVIFLIAIAIEHPKIWFSDTLNLDDMIDTIKNIPQENSPAYQDGIFLYNDNSFSIRLSDETKTIKWKDIIFIRAYKIDQYTVDCIVIEIYLTETYISINDQTPGYMKFMETASNKLANFKMDWFTVVAFPPFETNLTIIYESQTTDNKLESSS